MSRGEEAIVVDERERSIDHSGEPKLPKPIEQARKSLFIPSEEHERLHVRWQGSQPDRRLCDDPQIGLGKEPVQVGPDAPAMQFRAAASRVSLEARRQPLTLCEDDLESAGVGKAIAVGAASD